MKLNEDIYIESFLLESKDYSDDKLKEELEKLSDSCKVKLMEKVQEFKDSELTLENKNKIVSSLNEFMKDIDSVLENIEDRSKHLDQINALKGLLETAESLKKRLDSEVIRAYLKEPLKISPTSSDDNKENK